MKRLALLVLSVVGCADGYQLDYVPLQDEVLHTIASLYDIPVNTIPPIAWIRTDCLYYKGSMCVDGRFREASLTGGPELIEIAVPQGALWSQVPIAHEVCHVRELRKFGDSDQDHTGPCFNDPGERYEQEHGLTGRGNAALSGFGLVIP